MRLTFADALYLGAVAAQPTILISQTSANFFFGGTSILIVVGVALETVKQLEAQPDDAQLRGLPQVSGRRGPERTASAPRLTGGRERL